MICKCLQVTQLISDGINLLPPEVYCVCMHAVGIKFNQLAGSCCTLELRISSYII